MIAIAEPTTELTVGVHHNVPFETYCGWQAMNASTLVRGFVRDGKTDTFSPPHLLAAIEGRLPRVASAQTHLGHALHARLLEPERYASDYLVATTCQALIKSGDRKGAACGNSASLLHDDTWYCGIKGHAPADATQPAEFVTEEIAAKVENIATVMRGHKALKLLRTHGGFEESFVTTLEGVLCKGRCDKVLSHPPGKFPPAVIDVKTVSARRFGDAVFFRQVLDLHYHAKMSLYCKGLQTLYGTPFKAIFVIVETEQPHTISVRIMPDSLLEAGWRKMQHALNVYRECMESNSWPSLCGDMKPLAMPDWFDLEAAGG